MTRGRIEAFTDGVVAIIITIMVLELKVPEVHGSEALRHLAPVFLAYVLSFVNVGIYWSNHHHMFHAVKHIGGWVMWANLHLLFWLSLIPFTTAYIAEQDFESLPMALYALNLLMASIAYWLLAQALLAEHGRDSDFASRLGSDTKGKLSTLAYILALAFAWFWPWLSGLLIVGVALAWLVPDRRFARAG